MVGGDAEGDDFACIGRRVGLRAKSSELFSVLKHMVGGEHGDDRLRIMGRRPGGRGADGGGAVAPVRLEHDRRLGADLPQLLGDAKAVVEIGDDHRRIEHRGIAHHADNRLKGRTLPDQGNELLRQALPRFRPHARPRPAAHDHRHDFGHAFLVLAAALRNRQPGFLCNNGGANAMPRSGASDQTPVMRAAQVSDDHRGGGCRRERQREGGERNRQRQRLRDRAGRQRSGQAAQRAKQRS